MTLEQTWRERRAERRKTREQATLVRPKSRVAMASEVVSKLKKVGTTDWFRGLYPSGDGIAAARTAESELSSSTLLDFTPARQEDWDGSSEDEQQPAPNCSADAAKHTSRYANGNGTAVQALGEEPVGKVRCVGRRMASEMDGGFGLWGDGRRLYDNGPGGGMANHGSLAERPEDRRGWKRRTTYSFDAFF